MCRFVSKRSEGNHQHCGDVFVDILISKEQVLIHLETLIGVKETDVP